MIEFDDLLDELLYGKSAEKKKNEAEKKPAEKPEPKKKACENGKTESAPYTWDGNKSMQGRCVIVRYKGDHIDEARVTLGQHDEDGKREDSLALMYAVCNMLHDMLGLDSDKLAADMIGNITFSIIKNSIGAMIRGEWSDED